MIFKRLLWIVIVGMVVWVGVVVALAVSIENTGQDDQAQDADVIVVLGSGLRRDGRPGDALYRRSVWASELYQDGYAPHIICTGGVGEGQRRSEADACREVLESRGVPPEVIHLEAQSRSTEENAIYAGRLIAANGWQEVLLVTDSFHMLRASWVFEARGIPHVSSPVPREWVRDYFYNRHFTREILALHWQAFKEVFNLPLTNVS